MATPTFAEDLRGLADRAKALSHPARLSIIRHLAAHDECICGDIVASLPLAQSTVSRHLKVLQDVGIVHVTPDGPRSCYCLDRGALQDIRDAFDAFLQTPDAEVTFHS